MKILANLLLVVGLVTMTFGLLLLTRQPGVMPWLASFAGATLAVAAVFIRSRVREGIPIFAVTDEDKEDFKEMRREFGFRKLLGMLLANLGAIFMLAGVAWPIFAEPAEKVNWSAVTFLTLFGFLLVLCARPLLNQKNEDVGERFVRAPDH